MSSFCDSLSLNRKPRHNVWRTSSSASRRCASPNVVFLPEGLTIRRIQVQRFIDIFKLEHILRLQPLRRATGEARKENTLANRGPVAKRMGVPVSKANPASPPEVDQAAIDHLDELVPHVRNSLPLLGDAYVVEFSGLPRAGKSECIATVEHFLRRRHIPVLSPLEGARQAPERLKENLLAYNAWTATYALRQILEASSFAPPHPTPQIVLLDRGLFDATAWFQCLRNQGHINEDENKALSAFVTLDIWRKRVRKVFYFHCDSKTSMDRENRFKLIRAAGMVVAPDFLRRLEDAYRRVFKRYATNFDVTALKTDAPGTLPSDLAIEVLKVVFQGIVDKAAGIRAMMGS